MSKTRVTLTDGYRTTIQSGNHVYHSDEPEEAGGTDTAVNPTAMTMGALGSCIAMTMKMYAQRKGWPLQSVEIELDYERFRGSNYAAYEGDERYIHEIRKAITLHGNLTEDQRERILEIGARCPVHRLIDTPTFWVETVLEAEAAEETPAD